jgi:hypothetical protein
VEFVLEYVHIKVLNMTMERFALMIESAKIVEYVRNIVQEYQKAKNVRSKYKKECRERP